MRQREEGDFIRETDLLLKNKYGVVILDEAHKACAKGGLGEKPGALLLLL